MQKIVVFGVGYRCERLLEDGYLDNYHILAFVDNDKKKWGNIFFGKKILEPVVGLNCNFDKVLITIMDCSEVREQLISEFHIGENRIISTSDVFGDINDELHKDGLLYRMNHNFCPLSRIPHGEVSLSKEIVDDVDLGERIIEAYHETLKHSQEQESWWTTGWLWECKKDIHEMLYRRDLNKVLNVLRNPNSSNLFWGFESIAAYTKEQNINIEAKMVFDSVVQLASYLGIIRLPNPESLFFPKIDIDEILNQIAKKYDFDLQFENPYFGEIGLKTKRGIINYRSIQALYQVIKIKEILGKHVNQAKVLEIGAGLGRTAYLARQIGIRDYTILDIPMTNVAQSYFLGRVLGDGCVSFVGEGAANANKVKVLPAYALQELEDEKYDLILNIDSLTEMDEDSQKDYWSYIQNHAKVFLSINHEANDHTVREYYEGTELTVYRSICPMRKGYIEECIFFNKVTLVKV